MLFYEIAVHGGGSLKIENIGKVLHGATLSRIQEKVGENSKTFFLFTMQELNKETGQYGLFTEKQEVKVSEGKLDLNLISKLGDVIIGLTSYKAMVVEDKHKNKLIPSNFAIIEFDKRKIDPFYFTWYFNENPKIQKQLTVASQGTIIRALSVQMLRELDIPLPSIKIQRKIGMVYKLRQRKGKLLFRKNILEKKLWNQLLQNKLKEDL